MRISILPKSLLGWWSVGLVIASLVFFVLFDVILGPGPDYNMALAYALTTVIAGYISSCLCNGSHRYHKEQGAVYSRLYGYSNWLV